MLIFTWLFFLVVIVACMVALLDEPVYRKYKDTGEFHPNYVSLSNIGIAISEVVRIILTTVCVKEIAEAEETIAKWGVLDLLIVLVLGIIQL